MDQRIHAPTKRRDISLTLAMKSQHSAFDRRLDVFCQAPVAVQPSERPLYNPTTRQQNKAFGGVGSLDDS
jgi:hypothetical protein